jgi:hypothetical protein
VRIVSLLPSATEIVYAFCLATSWRGAPSSALPVRGAAEADRLLERTPR